MNEIDILNRKPTIGLIMDILRGLRDNRQSMVFSLNGKWGSGKTFVIKKLAERIEMENRNNSSIPFCYIRYDCWKYDYYAEPVIALVSAMQDAITNNTSEGIRDYIGSELGDKVKKLCEWSMENIGSFIQAQTGIDLSQILLKLVNNEAEEQKKSFDKQHSVTEALNDLRKLMTEISKNNMLVIVVDELDRCLPEYMIRILERLHHLFEGLENIVIIIATDRKQLEHTIKRIYGEKTDAISYLQKIIKFELTLDFGEIENEIVLKEKFEQFFSLFDENKIKKELNLAEFFEMAFCEIEIRKKIQWIEKLCLIHSLVFGNKKVGYDILYYEIFWTIFTKEYHITPVSARVKIDKRDPFIDLRYPYENEKPLDSVPLICYLKEKFGKITVANSSYNDNEPISIYESENDLNMLFWYWTKISPYDLLQYCLPRVDNAAQDQRTRQNDINQNIICISKFQELMNIIS